MITFDRTFLLTKHFSMKRHIQFILFTALAILSSCDERPSDVLSQKKMESVLYDYHLMQGMIEQLPSSEREKKAQDYINAVYQKYHISHADFERSLVYYNRHQKELNTIYGNVKDKLTQENDKMQMVNGSSNMTAVFANGGDTTNLWNTTKVLTLRNKPLLNKESFIIKADTSFHRHDQFILTFTPSIIGEDIDDYHIHLDFGLSVMYTSGRHIGVTRSVRNSGIQQLTLEDVGIDSANRIALLSKDNENTNDGKKNANINNGDKIKYVSCFFYYNGKKGSRNLCVIDNIQLIRMHEKETMHSEETDSLEKEDNVPQDTISSTIEERLSPEQLRMMNKSDKQIKIQKAPTMRHPNSAGPRRINKHPMR